jgi:hypothetical protein
MRVKIPVAVTAAVLAGSVLAGTVLAGTVLAGCGASPHPFEPVYGTGVGPLVTRPGWEFGYLFGLIKNRGHSTLTIDSVSLRGEGVGTVITLPDVRIAPVGGGLSIAQANYVTDPPVTSTGPQGCYKQTLKPVAGYRLRPGAAVRIWVVVRAARPGQWNIPKQVITYTDNGGTYQYASPVHYWGTVKTTARVSPVVVPGDYQPESCVRAEGSRYLDYYHAPS